MEATKKLVCRLRDYSALRASPFGSPCGRSTSLRDVVEPGLFYVGGSNNCRSALVAGCRYGGHKKVGLPAEGLLGAARLALRVALRAINVASRRCRTRLVLCRGFE